MSAMTLRRIALAVVPAALLVAGCAGVEPRYLKPDVPEAKMAEELKSCQADSQEAMSDIKKGAGPRRREQSDLIDQCMKAKGFSRATPP